MCTFKKELVEGIKARYKATNIAKTIGITNGYLSQILQSGKSCSQKTAYAITKYLDENAQIEDYFNINK